VIRLSVAKDDLAADCAFSFSVAARIASDPALTGPAVLMLTSADRQGDAAKCREVGAGPVLLVCATSRTGWAHTVAAAKLRDAGVSSVMPLVVHQLP